jgi:hypothetical protein
MGLFSIPLMRQRWSARKLRRLLICKSPKGRRRRHDIPPPDRVMNLDALSLFPEPITNILVACIACGAFGGWIAHFINNEKQAILQTVDQRGWFLFPSNWQSALIGVAGAIAFLFFIIAVGGLTTFSTLGEQIRIIAVSVIAGFGARSLLPRMVGQLEKQIAQAQKTLLRRSGISG